METFRLEIHGNIGQKDDHLDELGVENNFSPDDLRAALESEEAKAAEAVEIVINSDGGNVVDGFEMYDYLKGLNKKVITIGKKINSIASVLFLSGDERKVVKNVECIIHNAWLDPTGLEGVSLNQNTMDELLTEFKAIDEDIMAVYLQLAGRGKRQEMYQLMADEKALSADKMKEFNFATEIISEGEFQKGHPVAYTSNLLKAIKNQKSKAMADEKETKTILQDFGKKLEGLFALIKGSTVQNAVTVELDNEEGTKLYIFSEDGELEGKRVVLADEDGEPTETSAPAGKQKLKDGREIVINDNSEVEAVKEAASAEEDDDEEVAKLQKEMEEKEAAHAEEMEEKDKELKDLKAKFAKAQKQAEKIQKEFETLKNQVPGDKGPGSGQGHNEAVEISDEEFEKMSPAQKAIFNAKVMYNQKRKQNA